MKNDLSDTIDYLLSPQAIRERAQLIYNKTRDGGTHFMLDTSRLNSTAEFVIEVIRDAYPTLEIPFHSRWRHFEAGEHARSKRLNKLLKKQTAFEKLQAQLDLTIVAVLLDAGAGEQWQYCDPQNDAFFSRSEGLGIASFNMFVDGLFANNKKQPYQVDAEKLVTLELDQLMQGFQVDTNNPLLGIEGRLCLLHTLGKTIIDNPESFPHQRPSDILYNLLKTKPKTLAAPDILKQVLIKFSSIWPSRIQLGGFSLGDAWRHPLLGKLSEPESIMPFHKLSQWLTYSLLEPIINYGIKITDLNQMTGLAEYRNGGLFIDSEILILRDYNDLLKEHTVDSEVIIEWRALTIVLLDQLAIKIREALQFNAEEFPLVKMLEGGSWRAGRIIAKQKRATGGSPLKLISDGTVF